MFSNNYQSLCQHVQTTQIAADWQPLLQPAFDEIDADYLQQLSQQTDWLPGPEQLFNAFTLPLSDCKIILLGESPYPRKASANGYAFWDAAVTSLWSDSGLAKPVNRATSLRNFIKMLLVADKRLQQDTSQTAIAQLDKSNYVSTLQQLFANIMGQGILCLNASLVLSQQSVQRDAKAWRPFLATLLAQLVEHKPDVTLLLLGNIAKQIIPIMPPNMHHFQAEHPYNISFIHNRQIIDFFANMHLLKRHS